MCGTMVLFSSTLSGLKFSIYILIGVSFGEKKHTRNKTSLINLNRDFKLVIDKYRLRLRFRTSIFTCYRL